MSDPNDPYAPHAAFVAPAGALRDAWRIAVMMLGFEIVFLTSPLIFASLIPGADNRTAYFEGVTPLATLAQFATFGLVILGFVYLLGRVHNRGFWSLIGHSGQAVVDLWRVALSVGLALLMLEILPPWTEFTEVARMRNLLGWVFLLPFALVVLIIQVTAEEIYFRGYLQQQFACLSSSPVVWIGVPALVFGLLHYPNGQGFADGLMWTLWAFVLGIACADLTARTGTLGAAIGMHLSNNIFAVMLISYEGWPSSGFALFLLPPVDRSQFDYSASALASPAVVFELAILCLTVVIMWLAARVALRR